MEKIGGTAEAPSTASTVDSENQQDHVATAPTDEENTCSSEEFWQFPAMNNTEEPEVKVDNSTAEERDGPNSTAAPSPLPDGAPFQDHPESWEWLYGFFRLLRDEHVAESLEAISRAAKMYSKW